MSHKSHPKAIREARKAARAMTKSGPMSYRQNLDRVAKDAGHPHWNAFADAHANDAPEPERNDIPVARAFRPIPDHVRKTNGPIEIIRDMATVQEYDLDRSLIIHHLVIAASPLITAIGGVIAIGIIAQAEGRGSIRLSVTMLVAFAACILSAAPGVALVIRSFNATRILSQRRWSMRKRLKAQIRPEDGDRFGGPDGCETVPKAM